MQSKPAVKFTWELSPSQLLQYYLDNQDHLAPWDPPKPTDFYELSFWNQVIERYKKDHLGYKQLRFSLVEDEKVIGLFGISQIFRGPFQNGIMGYSLHHEKEGQGWLTSLLNKSLSMFFQFTTFIDSRLTSKLQTPGVGDF